MTLPIQTDARILDNRLVAREHYLLSLAAPEIARAARPGQFAMVRAAASSDPLLPRAFSFYAADGPSGRIDLLYRVVGAGTSLMSRMRPGESAQVWGPLGAGFTPATSGLHLLVGGGVGVPPIVFLAAQMAERARADPPAIRAFIGAATSEYLVGVEDLTAAGVPVAVATDDGSRGHRGFVTELLQEALARAAEPVILYACGPMPMLAAVARIGAEARVPCQVALEAPMACGVGACLGCTVPRAAGGYARVCADGPVFAAEEIEWSALA